MSRNRIPTVTKTWSKLTEKEKLQVKNRFQPWQNKETCKYVFTTYGELMHILDYSALGNMFKL